MRNSYTTDTLNLLPDISAADSTSLLLVFSHYIIHYTLYTIHQIMSMDNTKSQFVGATDSYNLFFNSYTPPFHSPGPHFWLDPDAALDMMH